MAFSHPLARGAKVWTAKAHDGGEQRVLVIVTTIPLEPGDKGYKKSLVERLSRAAQRLSGRLEGSRLVHAHEPDEGLERRQGLRTRRLSRRGRLSLAKLRLRQNGRFSSNLGCDRLRGESRDRKSREARGVAPHQLGTNAMTNAASALGLGPGAGIAPLRAKWGWIVALGVVYVIAGVIALGSVVMATIASVYVVGIMMLIAGVFEVIHSFQIKTWGRFLFWLALGVLYIIAGFVAFDNPLLTAVWLTLILGAALVASGIMRIFLGFNMQHGSPWIWVVVSGPDHAVARHHHPDPLAGLLALRARHLSRRRSRVRRRELDRARHGSANARPPER